MIKQSDVTIIIPHLGKTEEQRFALKNCLVSLAETCECPIILSVNGIDEEAKQTEVPDARFLNTHIKRINIFASTLQGQCKAVNAAAATVSTPWIMVSNDDMIYAPGWFEKLVEPMNKMFFSSAEKMSSEDLELKPHGVIMVDDVKDYISPSDQIKCISPILVEPQDGAPTFIKYFCGGAGGDFNKEKWLEFAKNIETTDGDKGSLIRTGFNLPFLIKKELWDLVGGYDVNYDPWSSNSDSDLEYKIKLAGIQPYQNTNAAVYHFSQTSGTFEPRNRPAWEKNWQYFIEKWGFPRTDDGIWQATFEIPTVNMGRVFTPWWEGFYNR